MPEAYQAPICCSQASVGSSFLQRYKFSPGSDYSIQVRRNLAGLAIRGRLILWITAQTQGVAY